MKPRHSSNADSEEILANIAETRAQMDDTLDELSERLQPRHILDDVLDYFRSRRAYSSGESRRKMRRVASKAAGQVKATAGQVKDQVKNKAGSAGRVAYSQVREHPLPALLIGAGISLLLMDRYRTDDHDSYSDNDGYLDTDEGTTVGYAELNVLEGNEASAPESYALPHHYSEEAESNSPRFLGKLQEKTSYLKGKGSELKQKAGSTMQNMKEMTAEKTSALRRRAGEKGEQLKQQARYRYAQSRESFSRTADEQPLAVGLGFLAIGVLAGMLLPSTRKEDELVGPTRDRVVNRTREAAQDAVHRGKVVAQKAVDVAKQQAQEQGLTPEALMQKTQAVAAEVKHATREDVQRQQQEFTEQVKHS
jgi:ElaB/YqjD/DUF883 family membrane-anchored ribosome-binding protein